MRNNNSAGHFPLGLLMLSLGLAAYKAAFLSMEMTESLAVFAELFVLDLSFLGLLVLLCVVHALIAGRVARSLFKALLALVVAFYIINSFVLLELDEYMNLFDLARYLPDSWLVMGRIWRWSPVTSKIPFLKKPFSCKPWQNSISRSSDHSHTASALSSSPSGWP